MKELIHTSKWPRFQKCSRALLKKNLGINFTRGAEPRENLVALVGAQHDSFPHLKKATNKEDPA